MTDREMLEYAAKAAGLEGVYDTDFDMLVLFDSYVVPTMWNPLKDDGDAFRLAVKLELYDLDKILVELDIHERATSHHLDPCAALRLAITRAAAAIGKEMP